MLASAFIKYWNVEAAIERTYKWKVVITVIGTEPWLCFHNVSHKYVAYMNCAYELGLVSHTYCVEINYILTANCSLRPQMLSSLPHSSQISCDILATYSMNELHHCNPYCWFITSYSLMMHIIFCYICYICIKKS